MSYLLQALPADLTDQETLQLQIALPVQLVKSRTPQLATCEPSHPSILHRGLASAIIFICLVLRVLLPYIKYFLAVAYRYERTHEISEKVFATGMKTANSLQKKSMVVVAAALSNEQVMDTVMYCVEGICGGLNEGLGEGSKLFHKARNDI